MLPNVFYEAIIIVVSWLIQAMLVKGDFPATSMAPENRYLEKEIQNLENHRF